MIFAHRSCAKGMMSFLPWVKVSMCFLLLAGGLWPIPGRAYITAPVPTLGAAVSDSTYVTLIRVEKVSREKGIIVYTKVRDLKGKYPKDSIRHVFDLKGTPRHQGPGDVPTRPDERDWQYALEWAAPGKLAVMFTRQYDPFGDFGHTYIPGCWYAIMCPPRNWEFWYAIYAEARLLHQWHCGTPSRLATAVEWIVSGREAVVPVLSNKSSKEDLRAGRAKLLGLLVSASRRDYQPGRDGVTEAVDGKSIPSLIQLLREGNREDKVRAARSLGLLESQTNLIVPALADAVRNDPSGTVRICAAETLLLIGQDAKTALPAIEASLNDPRMAQRRDVLLRLAEVREKLK